MLSGKGRGAFPVSRQHGTHEGTVFANMADQPRQAVEEQTPDARSQDPARTSCDGGHIALAGCEAAIEVVVYRIAIPRELEVLHANAFGES
ncbi:hypothetical protein ABT167_38525 [Streptomyces sp. NPDC001792]|uniref:hypothetical protein n=1 Tax=Streptomyces sp. NPDC001792 TaxID=3154524 RepID=UPI003325F0ED